MPNSQQPKQAAKAPNKSTTVSPNAPKADKDQDPRRDQDLPRAGQKKAN